MAKRNTLQFDFKAFESLLTKLDEVGGDIMEETELALLDIGETVGNDTLNAVQKTNLPAKGKFSKGDTEKSVIKNPCVNWRGSTASINIGFDYGKSGAGGFLITGTPRMKPVRDLNRMYKGKKYTKALTDEMCADVNKMIIKKMEG